MMPSLDEGFEAFATESLLLHAKSDDPEEGELVASKLGQSS